MAAQLPTDTEAKAGLIIAMTNDSEAGSFALAGLRDEGGLALLLPPWSKPVDGHFYPIYIAVRFKLRPGIGILPFPSAESI